MIHKKTEPVIRQALLATLIDGGSYPQCVWCVAGRLANRPLSIKTKSGSKTAAVVEDGRRPPQHL